MKQAKVLVPLAAGVEEIEAVCIIDILRRAEIQVVVAGLTADPIKASRGVNLIPDCGIADLHMENFDMIVIPGGRKGTDALKANAKIVKLLQDAAKQDKYIAAICAGPEVLHQAGMLQGRTATSHPSSRKVLTKTQLVDERVAIDKNLITSQGPGTAIEFALQLVEILCGPEKRRAVEGPLMA